LEPEGGGVSTLHEKQNQLWADFEKRTEHMTGRELAAEMDKHCDAMQELERDKPGDSDELRQERAVLREMRAAALEGRQ
jgi:hypothetical protein